MFICTNCAETLVKNGFRNEKQRFRCLNCGLSVTEGNARKGKPRKYRNNAEKQAAYRLRKLKREKN